MPAVRCMPSGIFGSLLSSSSAGQRRHILPEGNEGAKSARPTSLRRRKWLDVVLNVLATETVEEAVVRAELAPVGAACR